MPEIQADRQPNQQQHNSLVFVLFAILSAIFMATIGVFSRYTGLPAEQVTFYRLLLGALCLVVYMMVSGKKAQIRHKPSKRTVINGMMLAGFMLFYVQAINYTSMANAVMLIYLAPLLSAVIAHFAFAERLGVSSLLLIIIALFGFAMMMEFSLVSSGDENEMLGLFYGVLSAFTYSGFMLINRKPSDSTPYQSSLVQLSVGALCILPLVLSDPLLPTLTQSYWLLVIGIVPGFLAVLCAVKALRHLPAVTFGTLAYVEPVAVVVFAWWLFGETLNLLQLSGCGLIIVASIGQGFLGSKQRLKDVIVAESLAEPLSSAETTDG
jgi:drug/metabolite transporter (DMT)-like permease